MNPEALLIVIEALFDAFHQAPLADRATLVGAVIEPGIDVTADQEDAYFNPIDGNDLAPALRQIGMSGDQNLAHVRIPLEKILVLTVFIQINIDKCYFAILNM